MVEGHTIPEIAEELYDVERQAKERIYDLLKKLGVRDSDELAKMLDDSGELDHVQQALLDSLKAATRPGGFIG